MSDERIGRVLERLRTTHLHGGAFLAIVAVEPEDTFDWFASRNRLLENDLLTCLLHREEIRRLVPELQIPESLQQGDSQAACMINGSQGFRLDTPFLLDGQLAQCLFAGGAYGASHKIAGRTAMELANDYCEAAFQKRYEEVSLFTSNEPWTPWFHGIAWDWTSVLFDRRERKLHILLVTDTD